jgi:hypothetical protein
LVQLFVMVMEVLSWMLSRAMAGVYLSGTGYTTIMLLLEVSHLFPDDMLIMCDVDFSQIHNLRHILLHFEAIFA